MVFLYYQLFPVFVVIFACKKSGLPKLPWSPERRGRGPSFSSPRLPPSVPAIQAPSNTGNGGFLRLPDLDHPSSEVPTARDLAVSGPRSGSQKAFQDCQPHAKGAIASLPLTLHFLHMTRPTDTSRNYYRRRTWGQQYYPTCCRPPHLL